MSYERRRRSDGFSSTGGATTRSLAPGKRSAVQMRYGAGGGSAQRAAVETPAAETEARPPSDIQAGLATESAGPHLTSVPETTGAAPEAQATGAAPGAQTPGAEDPHARAVAALSPEQRSYYEEILAGNPTPTPQDRTDALATAKSSRPLSEEDRLAIAAALDKMASMQATPIDDGTNPHLVQIEITFDGTWNDRDQMAFDTNPALINDLFEGRKDYQVGVGTSWWTKYIGGATGAGIGNRVNAAYDRLVKQINEIKADDPAAEVVLIVTGFSRGATAARAFTNQLNRRGVPDLSSRQEDGSYTRFHKNPRIGVLVLFDTVGSVGIPGNSYNPGLDISIPANAENVLHLTARDEKRTFFPLSSAVDPSRPDDARITEVELPGAHSDVGGSYPNPYSQIPLQIAHSYMKERGVHVKDLDPATAVDPADPKLRLHDSGAPLWGTERTTYPSRNPR